MRLLLASDLHYALPQLDWILDQAAEFDVVVLAGDQLDISSRVALESQIVVVRTYLRKIAERTTLVVSSGNHDLTARNEHSEKAADWLEQADDTGAIVDWNTHETDRTRITVCPWWDGPATRAEVDELLSHDAIGRPDRWVWVYHSPPDGVPVSWIGSRHIGDPDLNAWIDRHQPSLVLTGHIHESPFRDGGSWVSRLGATWVVNAGRSPGPVPTHAVVDIHAGVAEWWSPYGGERKQLWDPLTSG